MVKNPPDNAPRSAPAPRKQPLRKDLQEPLFAQAGKSCSQEVRQVSSDHSHKNKRRLLLRRKAMTNLDSTLKSRDITLPTRVLVKAMVFPVVCMDVSVGP